VPTAVLVCRLALAVVFALAAVTKLADQAGARQAVAGFGVPEPLAPPVAALLPVLELAVAAALLVPPSTSAGAIAALALLGLFSAAIGRSMLRGEAPECHCFGQLHSEPAGRRSLARNVVLAAAAAFVLIAGWSDAGPSAVAWIGRLDGTGIVALAGGLALAAGAVVMVALLRQHGRLLLQLDELRARLDHAGVAELPPPAPGLELGATAPSFSLSGLYGDTTTLPALTAADRPVMLLFTDPGCGPCNALMPQIAAWQRDHAGLVSIAVLTRGDADENRAKAREHGVSNVWLDTDLAVYAAYEVPATPAGVLIDTDGQIASAVYAGADGIAGLVRAVTSPSIEVIPPKQIAQTGLPLAADAPRIELPDLDGERIVIRYEERETLVVFWNPGCGFCQGMLDELHRFEAHPPDDAPRLVLVAAGGDEVNRAQGLRAPILLDDTFATASAFGATGTPSAVLVDRSGKIASALGIGAPAVMALARRQAATTR
jgi:thiol-disulfide isomerase/thioredoxin